MMKLLQLGSITTLTADGKDDNNDDGDGGKLNCSTIYSNFDQIEV